MKTVNVRLLGTIEVRAGFDLVDLGPPRQRSVFAALAVDVGRPVQPTTIVERVWGAGAPPRARHALHVYIARIRQALTYAGGPADGAGLVSRRSGGYLLDAPPEWVDIHQFKRLLDSSAHRACPEERRLLLLRQALELWRGTPLSDIDGEWAASVRDAWQRQRLDAVVRWAEAELRVGNHSEVVGPLAELSGEHPLVEPLTVMHMRALWAAGRGAEALDSYARLRERLAEELGADPGTAARRVHQDILRGVPARDARPSAAPRDPPSSWVTPRQLPAQPATFVGRVAELKALTGLVGQDHGVAIAVIDGMAGVGKTALAVQWAHHVADRFPDGQLYVNLRGFDPSGRPMEPGEAMRMLLGTLGVEPARVPAELDSQVALYRTILADRRVLVVLDNAADAAQVRPLLPSGKGCIALVTGRSRLAGLIATEGAHPIGLALLNLGEARHLLARRLGEECLVQEDEAVTDLIGLCAGLPLALHIAAAYLAGSASPSVTALIAQLREPRDRLDALDTGDSLASVRAVFSWSLRRVTPTAARLFRLLGLHPGPDLSAAAAASLAGVPRRDADRALRELTHAHLLGEPAPGRYACHDLLRAYAGEEVVDHETAADRAAATHRMLDHYLHTAHSAALLLDPNRDPMVREPPRHGVVPEAVAGYDEAMSWFSSEHRVMVTMLEHAASIRRDEYVAALAWTLADFFQRQGYGHDWVAAQRVAVDATQRLGDVFGQARAHRLLARAYVLIGRTESAETSLKKALDLFDGLGDRTWMARASQDLGWIAVELGRPADALSHIGNALVQFQALGDRLAQAFALNNIGWCHHLLGEHERTLESCRQALDLFQELGDRNGEAQTWDSIGRAYHQLGAYDRAVDCYERALALHVRTGHRHQEADTLVQFGDTRRAVGDLAGARQKWQGALTILEELSHPDAEAVRERLATS